MLKKNNQKGFTIIEVLIVLAIAGLIMLVVFLAVPALQRNSRNTQRKNDVSVVLGAISEYNTLKNGKMPVVWDSTDLEFQNAAADAAGTGVAPKLGYYTSGTDIIFANSNAAVPLSNPITSVESAAMYVRTGAKCNATATNVGGTGATSRSIAVVYVIEKSGGSASVCQES